MFSYELRPKDPFIAAELLNEVKKNPLASELIQKINEDRRQKGRPPITVNIQRGIYFGGDCNRDTGEIRINYADPQNEQLATLVYEICNLEPTLSLYRSNLWNKIDGGRYPIRREICIREEEKFGQIAGLQMINIYRYGVAHLGWDREILEDRTQFFQRSFKDYYNSESGSKADKEYRKNHKEVAGADWDEAFKCKSNME